MAILNIILFYFLVHCGTADYCQYNFTIYELPGGFLTHVIDFVTKAMAIVSNGCPKIVYFSPSDVKLWLFNRSNKDTPILLDQNNPTELDASKKTIILVPGWLCNVTNEKIPELKDAYLDRYDANIIGIDWTAHSIAVYTDSFCSVPEIAKVVARFLCNIDRTKGIRVNKLHLIGHSMGAQLCGFIGDEVKLQCNKTLGRITALDPAGVLYNNVNISRRLDKTDAEMVDVIHTNNLLGYFETCGSVDFFPNCFSQPNCTLNFKNIQNNDILNVPVSFRKSPIMWRNKIMIFMSLVTCNHLISVEYMIESINGNRFIAKSCKECPGSIFKTSCVMDVANSSLAYMGEDCSPNAKDKKYYLETNSQSPFAKSTEYVVN